MPSPFEKLSALVAALPGATRVPAGDPAITGIALDSRQVRPGDLFVALPGLSRDGHTFITAAIANGAAAVAGTQPLTGLGVPYIQVADSRLALAYFSAALYGFPARHLTVIGVTGTDGKTTTCSLIYHILKAAGLRVGMISTVSALIDGTDLDTGFHVTTPEAPDVQRYLAAMRQAGLTHVVLEATSHGLAQHRVAACEFDVGMVTNVTHEHLDFHGSLAAYQLAKALLFQHLEMSAPKRHHPPRAAVLNRDDSSFGYLSRIPQQVPLISYGFDPLAQVQASAVTHTPVGMAFSFHWEGQSFSLHTPLAGLYNVSNCLAALAVCVAVLGVPIQAAGDALASFPGVPGRMQRIDLGQDFTAVVDFAHTPNALHNVLLAGREMAARQEHPGRVIAVFGSAGLRDRQKRRMMAQTAAGLADLSILTAEDPRTESLEGILGEMAAAMQAAGAQEGHSFWRIPDRGAALRQAVALARPGDILLVCGKGHEQSMCFGETEYPWDDRTALQTALAERLGLSGYRMPHLPTSQ